MFRQANAKNNYEEMISLSDDELVSLALNGSTEGFGVLIERYEKSLRRYLVRLTGWGEEETEDILQEAFIKVYRHLNDYDEQMKFSTWIYRITHNQAIDIIRSSQARPFLSSVSLEEIANLMPAEEEIERSLHWKNDLERVRKVIAELPLQYREVLILRFLEEKSYEEIVDILKKPKGTVATLITRGRKLLQEKLRDTL
jgi:RNA polymerase sigma-70 factor (ECF subfamily)